MGGQEKNGQLRWRLDKGGFSLAQVTVMFHPPELTLHQGKSWELPLCTGMVLYAKNFPPQSVFQDRKSSEPQGVCFVWEYYLAGLLQLGP